MPRFGDPAPLDSKHALDDFSCGEPSLDVWLREHARQAMRSGSARTYVVQDSTQRRVVAYHALAAGSIEHADAAARAARGMPRHPIPVVLLARLAVDQSVQAHGLGALLLRDAMIRTLAASEQLGIRALLVHALNEEAAGFYTRHGLEPSPTDPLHLMMLVKDIRRALEIVAEAER